MTNVKKICNVCNVEKDITDFYFRKENGKYRDNCKKCKPIKGRKFWAERTVKVCIICEVEKPLSDFNFATGCTSHQSYCRDCDSDRKKKYAKANAGKIKEGIKKYRQENKEAIAARVRRNYEKDRERILQYTKDYNKKNAEIISAKNKVRRDANIEKVKERSKQYRLKNHERSLAKEKEIRANKTVEQKERDKLMKKEWELKHRKVLNERYKDRKRKNRRDWCNMKSATDIEFKILKNLRGRTRFALKRDGAVKSAATEKLLGCTIPEFRAYFESLFTEGMTWELFMAGEIHIDHKIPCIDFCLSDPQQQRECFNYRNLQPLFKLHNLQKGTKNNEEWKSQSMN